MNALNRAKTLADTLENARIDLETFLEPFRKMYLEFMFETKPNYHDHRDLTATTFIKVDGENYIFEGEEYYEHGGYETPTVELPFDFVANPILFMDAARAEQEAQRERYTKLQEEAARNRIDHLRRQLALEETALAKANAQGDPIKATATQNTLDKLKQER